LGQQVNETPTNLMAILQSLSEIQATVTPAIQIHVKGEIKVGIIKYVLNVGDGVKLKFTFSLNRERILALICLTKRVHSTFERSELLTSESCQEDERAAKSIREVRRLFPQKAIGTVDGGG
jgi:hypothetical protein